MNQIIAIQKEGKVNKKPFTNPSGQHSVSRIKHPAYTTTRARNRRGPCPVVDYRNS